MKLSEKVLDAMSGIDEKLLKESEEYTGKRKAFDLRILVMAAAVLLFAVIIIPRTFTMNSSQSPAGNAAGAAAEYGEMPQEAGNEAKGTVEEDTAACAEEEGREQYMITDSLREALQAEGEVKISAAVLEGGEPVDDDVLAGLCEELAAGRYGAYMEGGKIIFTVNASEFTTEILPDRYEWVLDLYN